MNFNFIGDILFALLFVILIPIHFILSLILYPIRLCIKLFRNYRYNKWFNEWLATLSDDHIKFVEEKIGAPLSLHAIVAPPTIIAENNLHIKIVYHYPILMSSDFSSLTDYFPSKQEFIKGLNSIAEKYPIENFISKNKRIFEALLKLNNECVICREPLNINNSILFKCTHIFHAECYENIDNAKCPLCRDMLEIWCENEAPRHETP